MAGMTKEQEDLIHQAEQLIRNAQAHPEMTQAMAPYGYDQERWDYGRTLIETAKERARAKETAYGGQFGSTNTYRKCYNQAWDQCQTLAKICASLLRDDTERLQMLGLHKRRKDNNGSSELIWPRKNGRLAQFLPWARNLHVVAHTDPEVGAAVAEYGFTAEQIAAGAAIVEVVGLNDHDQELAKAAAQQSRIDRDQAFTDLKTWVRCTEQVARLATKGKRSTLKATGLRV
jgi:hypothetical protein